MKLSKINIKVQITRYTKISNQISDPHIPHFMSSKHTKNAGWLSPNVWHLWNGKMEFQPVWCAVNRRSPANIPSRGRILISQESHKKYPGLHCSESVYSFYEWPEPPGLEQINKTIDHIAGIPPFTPDRPNLHLAISLFHCPTCWCPPVPSCVIYSAWPGQLTVICNTGHIRAGCNLRWPGSSVHAALLHKLNLCDS